MATMVPAQLAGAETTIGTLAKGLYADLLLIKRTVRTPIRHYYMRLRRIYALS
jgi:imidazolonepropionase-like amidohydrolase